ncbi:MAG: transglutaminaseTgpA domain-containing protein [Haloarculaceae archaeon]
MSTGRSGGAGASAGTRSRARSRTSGLLSVGLGAERSTRLVALAGVGLLVASYFSVLYHFIDVSPSSPLLLVVEAGLTLGLATYLSESLRARVAAAVAVGLLAVGLTLYVSSLPRWPPLVPLVADAFALATGRSLLQLINVDLWVLGIAPGPLFLTWYLGLRRRYVSATLVGGATLGYLVLSGNAGDITTLLGVVGAAIAVGVGDIDRRGDALAAAEPLAVLLAVMILLSGFASVVPGGTGAASGLSGFQGGDRAETVEASLVDAGSQIGIQGNISLSPEVRFTVESDRPQYWRVDAFDRYTGSGWIRTGNYRGYAGGDLASPPGETRLLTQEYTVVDELGVMPAAWKPASMRGGPVGAARVSDEGGFDAAGSLEPGSNYTVESQVPLADATTLRSAGTDYPDRVRDRYTTIPSSTPDRVEARTDRITANADNPYDTARVIEQWLENNREYSLDVERPEGNVADAFLFEMDAGYCTYFATTMVTMLRSQDIPARFVVGYTTGQRVDRDEYVVRGYDAHAWVEVYFPDVGWVRFDPTPAGPRRAVEGESLAEARENNRTDVDTNETLDGEWTPTPTATPAPLTPPDENPSGPADGPVLTAPTVTEPPQFSGNAPNVTVTGEGTTAAPGEAGESGGGGIDWPTREEATLAGIAVFGIIVGIRRLGLAGRVYRAVWVRYQPRADPATDAERAFDRLEYLLEQRYRPRRPGETPRQYLAAIGADERARTVATIRERARYAGDVTREEADEAVSLVDDLVAN